MIPSSMLVPLLVAAGLPALHQDAAPDQVTVHAETLYTSAGDPVANAVIVIEDGKIVAISPGVEAPRDAVKATVVTAGLIDASARIHTGRTSTEQSSEVTPSIETRHGIDPFDVRWKPLARTGVTTAFVAPENENCIGGLGIALKTAGPVDLTKRALEGDTLMCGTIGSSPSRGNSAAFGPPQTFYSRRPTTRMGVEWEWRQAFFDAAQAESGDVDSDTKVLQDVLAGKAACYIQAYATQDIRTAVYLKEEMQREGFGTMRLVIDCAAEAWREPGMLTRTKTAVVLPPFPSQGRTRDRALMPLDTPKKMLESGIPMALSAHGSGDPASSLYAQAAMAMRGGLSRAQALRAVTITPAEILGIQDRVGTVEVGKDADLVLWNGEPFEITSKPVGVVIDGSLIVDPR